MAEDLDDGEFWLPSEFLTDDILMDKENRRGFEDESKVCFPYEFPYAFDSCESPLSSPVESVVSTESDEQDYMTGLSRQMAQSRLLDEEKLASHVLWNENPKTKKILGGSPQSTLCEVGNWSVYRNGSSRTSSNGLSQVSSPPTTPMGKKDDAWDLLYAAAGEVVSMKLNDEGLESHGRGLLGPPRKPAPSPVAALVEAPSAGYYSNETLTHLQMQHNLFQLLKKQQLMKQQSPAAACRKPVKVTPTMQQQQHHQFENRARAGGFGHGRCGRSLGLSSSAWPILPLQQQQAGSGLGAVFVGSSSSKRESSGTGVFLPRRAGNPAHLRNKPEAAIMMAPLSNMLLSPQQQKRSQRPHRHHHHHPSHTASNCEIRLPPEWTY